MLTDNEYEVLGNLRPHPVRGREWLRPLDFGGHDASHHSNTARRLAERGLVEMCRRGHHDEPYTADQVKALKGRQARLNEKRAPYDRITRYRGGPKEYRITDAGLGAFNAERERRNQ